MSDYQGTPVYRERHRRRTRYRLSRFTEAIAVILSAVVAAMTVLAAVGLLLLLPGCTTLTTSEQRELEAQARGCYCKGLGCRAITSASGRAAAQAAGETSSRATQINQLTR